MIRSLLIKLGATALASFAIAGGWLTDSAQADVVVSRTGIGGRTQLIDPMRAYCEHQTYTPVLAPQISRQIWVLPSYVRVRNVSGEAVTARVRIKQHYTTGWRDQFVTNWQQFKYDGGPVGDSPNWYFFDWQKGVQFESWEFLPAGYYQAYVDYRWYAGGQLVGTATVGAERRDWTNYEDGYGSVAWLGGASGQVGYCALPL